MNLSQGKTLLFAFRNVYKNFGYYNKIKHKHLCTKQLLMEQKENESVDSVVDKSNKIESLNDDKKKISLIPEVEMQNKYEFNSDLLQTEEDPNIKLNYQFDENDEIFLNMLSTKDIENISSNVTLVNKLTSRNENIELPEEGKSHISQNEFNYDEYMKYFNQLPNPLDDCNEDLSQLGPSLPPTFNFAAYANKSKLIQTYVKLGVELYKIEKNPNHMRALLDISLKELPNYLQFFHDTGVLPDDFGKIITLSPMILKEELEDIKIRVRYLQAHEFTQKSIARIVTKNPTWLTWPTKYIDERLGHFQHEFKLNGPEVRLLATKQPKIITYKMKHINENIFAFVEQMGFSKPEAKIILLAKPRMWMQNRTKILNSFDYLHTTMNLSHSAILANIETLTCRVNRLKNRHEFLLELGKVQYDPKKPGYISPKAIVTGSDEEFCKVLAKTSVHTYNLFLKTR